MFLLVRDCVLDKLDKGCLPERGLLEKYDLLIYDDFCTALR